MRTIARTTALQNILKTTTQLDYYKENLAHSATLKLVELNNKTFGERMQKIVIEFLNLDPSSSSGHDAQLKDLNLKFEIKSSRYWLSSFDFKWQHIMEYHDYDYLILTGLDFNEINMYVISKLEILDLKEKGIIKQQGGGEGQGLWFARKKVESYLHKVDNKMEFYNIITCK
jgi:hypothetical protein